MILLGYFPLNIIADNLSNIYDYGEIIEGEKPKHTFTYINKSSTTIKILKIRIPCGCAEAKVNKKNLKPGEKAQFTIKLKTKGRRGKIKKTIYLLTDADKLSIVKYILIANIKPKPVPVCFAPSVLKLGSMLPNGQKNSCFIIENKGVLDLIVQKGVVASSVIIRTKLPFTVKPKEKKTVKINFTAPLYEGKYRTNIMLKTNDNAKTNLWVLITANVSK